MKKTKRHAGFLDGYRAGNVAILEEKIDNELKLINDGLEELLDEGHDNKQLMAAIKSSKTKLEGSYEDVEVKLLELGESLVTVAREYKQLKPVPSYPFKNVIYKYLDLAEQLDDDDVTRLALKLGETFQSSK